MTPKMKRDITIAVVSTATVFAVAGFLALRWWDQHVRFGWPN